MDYDKDKVDEMVLALLFLTLHDERRAWKGHDWDALGRLHTKGMISDPVGKAKSVVLTDKGILTIRKLGMCAHLKGTNNSEWVASLDAIQRMSRIIPKQAADIEGVGRTFRIESLGQLLNRIRIAGNLRTTPAAFHFDGNKIW